MDWGLRNRLSRIIKQDGRTVMLAVDHGYFLGPIKFLEDPKKTITPLIPYVDAIMPTRGVVRNCIDPNIDVPIVLRVSGGNSIMGRELSQEAIITCMEDAIRLNVSAVAFSIYIGAEYEHQTLVSLSKLVDEGERYGMPVLAVTAVGKELEKRDAKFLSLACRIVAELGAHFIKTYYCEGFEEVTQKVFVPLVIAGGPKMRKEEDVFNVAYNAIKKGAVGVDMGRNIWQNKNPIGMIKAIRAIVHENRTDEEAYEIFIS
ncbi:TPA: 3-hydroxy-5-phosphonooxypentane-2,4-dione thiolase [bacterium]|nr:3-hydroxy-5-phosphonooxypentane-2,4-dione thiolase [bacterium]